MQAEAILNMRLRSLRKLEEMEIKGEHKELTAERKTLNALMKSEPKQWDRISGELRSEEHTSELQSLTNLVCRLLLEKKKKRNKTKK